MSYLSLAISGALGYLVIRGQLYDPADAAATAANLIEHQTLARVGIIADLAIVISQAVVALLFYKLFRHVDSLLATALAAFGFMGAASILVATVFSATAIRGSGEGSPDVSAQTLYELSESAWGIGGISFGLWLIPMGWLVLRTATMPRPLGWILIAGGVGYLLSTAVTFLAPDATEITEALTAHATIGEVWMIGYLMTRNIDPMATAPVNGAGTSEASANERVDVRE